MSTQYAMTKCTSYYEYDAPVGRMRIACDGVNITELCMCDDTSYGKVDDTVPKVVQDLTIWLKKYFSGIEVPPFEKIAPNGTAFQKEVWDILIGIPYGKVMTYGDIAKTIAERRGMEKMSAQAVGNAVGKNHILIVVPCHRVVASGDIGGFEYGIGMKKKLLAIEGVDVDALSHGK